MEYYKSNAIYDYLKSRSLRQFKFVIGNAWQLIYGDSKGTPRILVYAVGIENKVINNEPTAIEQEGYDLFYKIVKKSGLPIAYIRFASDIENIETVSIMRDSGKFDCISMQELNKYFQEAGLSVNSATAAKYLNDKASSAYHNWQRNNLGRDISVSDIDLWKIDASNNPEIIIELKRSYYELERWEPFRDDYKNFMLVSNLCNMAGIKFKIIYNQRIKSPFQDKIDKLRLFEINFSKNPPIRSEGIITLQALESL